MFSAYLKYFISDAMFPSSERGTKCNYTWDNNNFANSLPLKQRVFNIEYWPSKSWMFTDEHTSLLRLSRALVLVSHLDHVSAQRCQEFSARSTSRESAETPMFFPHCHKNTMKHLYLLRTSLSAVCAELVSPQPPALS